MQWLEFENRDRASRYTAERLADHLRGALSANPGRVTVALSGGSTPQACYRMLANTDLEWQRVDVTLTDERCVPATHTDSNTRMLHQHLFKDSAAQARFVSMHSFEQNPEVFNTVLLGMGADGHFASLFPDALNLNAALDLSGVDQLVQIKTASSPYVRLSLTLQRLLQTQALLLLVFGEDKREVIRSCSDLPVEALLQQQQIEPTVIWAP